MNKKILIGSIIVIAILIGVSFTSVVGYRSVASDVKASPLFNIRSSRAIDEESGDLSCAYVGKGEDINIPILKRSPNGFLINRALNLIKKMDRDTIIGYFDEFMNNREILMDKIKNMKYINKSLLEENNLFTVNTYVCDPECPIPSIYVVLEEFCLFEFIVGMLVSIFTFPFVLAFGVAVLVGLIILLPMLPLYFLYSVFNEDCDILRSFQGPFSCACDTVWCYL